MPPCSPVAIALPLNVLGVKSINARARASKDVLAFSERHARRLSALIHLGVAPSSFSPFRNSMGRTFALACQTSTKLNATDRVCDTAHVARPVSLIHRDLHSRKSISSVGAMSNRNIGSSSMSAKSHRVSRTIHIGTGTSSQSALVLSWGGRTTRQKPHRCVNNNAINLDRLSGIFIRWTGDVAAPNYPINFTHPRLWRGITPYAPNSRRTISINPSARDG